jgi:SAM-dependent methyltransferase
VPTPPPAPLISTLCPGWIGRRPAGSALRGIDPEAVDVAGRNAKGAEIQAGDARSLPFGDGSVGACVSNLPFGHQYQVAGGTNRWLKTVLGEMARVTREGGRVVVLIPDIPRSLIPRQLKLAERHPIRLLGMQATIWAFDRVAGNESLSLGNVRPCCAHLRCPAERHQRIRNSNLIERTFGEAKRHPWRTAESRGGTLR